MANRFYFAYGSNMNPDRIRQRIPQARPVGTAFILGWRIKERLYADIDKAKAGRVDGVLYLLLPNGTIYDMHGIQIQKNRPN